MSRIRTATVALALALAASAFTLGTGTAVASAAEPNDSGSNCHGVYLSYLASSGMSPGQLHHEYDASVQDVQSVADALCQ